MRLSPGVPVLWRGDGRAQVGLARPLLLEGDDARVAVALEGAAAPPHVPGRLRAALAAAGLSPSPTAVEGGTPAPCVRVRGLSAVGRECAIALARAGVGALSLVDASRAWLDDDDRTAGAVGSRAARAARTVGDLGLAVRVGIGDSRAVDAEVVVAVGSIGAVRGHALALAGVPHVGVLTDEAGASIVPVRPGVTACLRCRDLALTDADPAWPALARQCEAREPWCSPPTAAVAGALAAAALLALLAPREAPGAYRVEGGLPRAEPLEPHPDCGCLA